MRDQDPQAAAGQTRMVLISAELPARNAVERFRNRVNNFGLVGELKAMGASYAKVQGCYGNETEQTYAVLVDLNVGPEDLRSLGYRFSQESIVLLDAIVDGSMPPRRPATLLMCDRSRGEDVDVGYFKGASRERALEQNGYIFDPSAGQYYVYTTG